MTRLRWRAIAIALGVPRSERRLHARLARGGHKRWGNRMSKRDRWTLPLLREWAAEFETDEPTTVTLSLGPDGLRIEENEP